MSVHDPEMSVVRHDDLYVPCERWLTEHGDYRTTPWGVGYPSEEIAREAIEAYATADTLPVNSTFLSEASVERLQRSLPKDVRAKPQATSIDEESIELTYYGNHALTVYAERFASDPAQPEYRTADIQFVNDMLTSTIYGVPAAELRKLGRFLMGYADTLEREEQTNS